MSDFKIYCNLIQDDCRIYQKMPLKQILEDRKNVLEELVRSEENYVRELGMIVEGYMVEACSPTTLQFDMPEGFRGAKAKIVFRSIEKIYQFHLEHFLPSLKNCLEIRTTLSEIFILNGDNFKMYVEFCRHKSISEQILQQYSIFFEETRKNLRIDLTLAELLRKPIHRFLAYELYLKELLNYSKGAGKSMATEAKELEVALKVIKDLSSSCNYVMDFEKLQKFTKEISGQGNLLISGTLACKTDLNAASENLRGFLFEKIIVFAYIVDSVEKLERQYIYKTYIQISKLKVKCSDNKTDKTFTIYKVNPIGVSSKFICQAETPELSQEWIDAFNKLIPKKNKFSTAVDFLKEIVSIDGKKEFDFKMFKNEPATTVFYD